MNLFLTWTYQCQTYWIKTNCHFELDASWKASWNEYGFIHLKLSRIIPILVQKRLFRAKKYVLSIKLITIMAIKKIIITNSFVCLFYFFIVYISMFGGTFKLKRRLYSIDISIMQYTECVFFSSSLEFDNEILCMTFVRGNWYSLWNFIWIRQKMSSFTIIRYTFQR